MIYLIRHGQASFLKSDYDKLSDLGVRQSKILGESLKDRKQLTSVIVRGDLVRHQETMEHCLKAFGHNIEGVIDHRWNEYDHMELLAKHNAEFSDHVAIGEYLKKQDHPMRALQESLNVSIMDWIDNKHSYSISWSTFKEGVWTALHDISNQLSKGENAWIFSSGGPISAVLIQLLSLKDEQFVELQGRLVNCSITKVIVGKKRLSLSTYNEYSHLDHHPDLITYR
ncbi:histidine phosphatase family protein [Ekhidna sp.]|uniref:histidine phosphatase family protein n=1 Tax=Ekhidna sp. TaxID=2608089 RepID=UPI0032994381